MRSKIAACAIVMCCEVASSAETVTASGHNPTAVGQARDVTVNNNDNRATNISHTQNRVYNMADVSKLNALQRHQDALLIAEHPTKVIVANADFVRWTSDSEQFLTITLSNVSKLPAINVVFGISDQMFAGPSKSPRFVAVTQSKSVPKHLKLEFGIDPNETLTTPLISITDLRRFLNLKQDYCIVMSRVVGDTKKFPNQGSLGMSLDYAVPVAYMYRSIFEQKYIANTVLSVVVTRRDSLISSSPNDSESSPKCID